MSPAGQIDPSTSAPLDKFSKQIARIDPLQRNAAKAQPTPSHCHTAIKDRITPGMIRHVCIIAAVLQQRCASLAPKTVERRSALAALASLAAPANAKSYQSGLVFEGGAGGLTKTKPNTGVKQAAGAVDDERPKTKPAGPVAARLAGRKGLPVDVAFDAPFPTTPGLVSRDYQTGDGAYVLVAPAKGPLKKVVADKIFAADGKYGSYGAPSEVKLKGSERRGDGDEVFEYTFVALTPAMREVARRVRARAIQVGGDDVFILVAGSTAARWRAAEPALCKAVDSFAARPAPEFSAEMVAFRKKGGK